MGLLALSLAAALAVQAAAQQPAVLRAVCRADVAATADPGLQWLVTKCLPQRGEWPAELPPDAPLAIELSREGLRIGRASVPPPQGCALAGSVSFERGPDALWSCAPDGTEDWYLPLDFAPPSAWSALLQKLQVDALQTPRTFDLAVLLGHLTTGAPDGDPRAALLHVGATACGPVTWTAWRSERHLRVRGRSLGGLMLPAVLVHLAASADTAPIDRLPLRAFTSRDGDRDEATRQLVRASGDAGAQTLRALLHGDDLQRLVAIDALVRRGDTAALPRIVAAASPQEPLASLAACDAVRSLFAQASPLERQQTRAAINRSADRNMRAIDVEALLPTTRRTTVADDGSQRARVLALLCLAALSLYGLWSRERSRLRHAMQF